jgi:hypothetical protein
MRSIGLSLFAGAIVVGSVWLYAQVERSSSRPPEATETASQTSQRAAAGWLAGDDGARIERSDLATTPVPVEPSRDSTPATLKPILALSDAPLTPAQANQRYLETLRASGGNHEPWARTALEATDVMTRDLVSAHPDATVSGVECHAAGCTFVVTAKSGAALEERVDEVMDHPAIQTWQGARAVLPVADVDGKPSQRWLLLQPTQS